MFKRKNQWQISDIYSGRSRSFDIRTKRSYRHSRSHFRFGSLIDPLRKSISFMIGMILTKLRRRTPNKFLWNYTGQASSIRGRHKNRIEIPQLKWLFSNVVKGGLTVLISVLIIFTVVQAATDKITPPTGTPVATFYSLSEIYNFITANTAATEGSPALDWSSALEDTQYTLKDIYNALVDKIALLDPTKILDGETYFGVDGTMVNNGAFSLTASSTNQTVAEGYYTGGTLPAASSTDTDLIADNIRNNIDIFGVIGNMVAGWLYGDNSDPAQVLTTAGSGAGGGTFNVSNLLNSVIKRGITWGNNLGETGTYSGYPGTAWSGTAITQAACDAQNPTWYWFTDGNGDGDTTDAEDGVCVRATPVTSLSWNGAEQIAVTTSLTNQTATNGSTTTISATGVFGTTNYANMVVRFPTGATAPTCWGVVKSNDADTVTVYGSWLGTNYNACGSAPGAGITFDVKTDGFDLYDNSWIGDWTCTGSFPSGAPSWGSFPTSAQVGAGYIALATTDCYDGTRDLLPTEASRAVKTGTATATSTTSITDTSLSLNTNAWVGQKVLITGGTGSGGYGRIESNTATVITVDGWTSGDPDVGSTFGIVYLIPHATYNPTTDVDGDDNDQLNGNNGPLTQEVLNNWKGARLPTASDFFGFCGYKDGGSNYESTTGTYTTDKTYGNYGGQVGRTDEFLDLANSGNWEWLSEQHYYNNARVAGGNACSHFNYGSVYDGYRFRAVFRP